MFDYYYMTIIFLAVFIMCAVIIMVQGNDTLDKSIKNKFYAVAGAVIVASVCEWAGVQLDETAQWLRPLHIFVKIVEFSVAPVVAVICADIIGRIKYKRAVFVIIVIQAALEIISGFTGMIFYVDSNNIYGHGNYYWLYILSFAISILYFIVVTLQASKQNYGTRKILPLMLVLLCICGLALQYCGASVRVIWLCIAMDILLVYAYYSELILNIDALTHLLNRRCYESRCAVLNTPVMFFFFDVDDFKTVNDTYGHSTGDEVLVSVAAILQDIYGKNGRCYRIGGDEFCALVNIQENEAQDYNEKLYQLLSIQRVANPRLTNISIGYAFYNPEMSSVADTIATADANMYECKKQHKAGR